MPQHIGLLIGHAAVIGRNHRAGLDIEIGLPGKRRAGGRIDRPGRLQRAEIFTERDLAGVVERLFWKNQHRPAVEGGADGIVYTNLFTGVHGNYLRSSIESAGLDPDDLPVSDPTKMNFGSGGNTKAKAWKDVWGSGQGIGTVTASAPVEDTVARLEREYTAAKESLARATA